jgi:hypothetical protein
MGEFKTNMQYIYINLSIAQIIGPLIKVFLFQFCEVGGLVKRKSKCVRNVGKANKIWKYNKHLGWTNWKGSNQNEIEFF